MGCKSFQNFFDHLCYFETRSLSQTKSVLMEKEQLKSIIVNIITQVKAGLSTLAELRKQFVIFKKNENDIVENRNFKYEVEETVQYLVDLPRGHYVTDCLNCHITCHENRTICNVQRLL